jgi:hypothetical protein
MRPHHCPAFSWYASGIERNAAASRTAAHADDQRLAGLSRISPDRVVYGFSPRLS